MLLDDGDGPARGDSDFPVNRGQLCIKGFTSTELLRRDDRIRRPLVRGRDGVLRTAGWDAALDELAYRLSSTRRTHGPGANAVFGSGALTNEKAYLVGKFARVALGTPHVDYNGRFCMASAAAGARRAFGIDRGLPFPVSDIERADVLVLWGSNCLDTMPPVRQWIDAQREAGGTRIVVDPRRSATVAEGDLHLQLIPGSDLALANGLLHAALVDGLVNETFVRARTTGFAAVRSLVLASGPDEAERRTGIAWELIRRAAQLMASGPATMLLSGRGPEQQTKGVDTVNALTNLVLALGQIGRPGAGYGCITGQGNGQGGRELGQKADQLPGCRSITSARDRAHVAAVWGIDPERMPGPGWSAVEIIDHLGVPGGIHSLLVVGANLAVAAPDAGAARAALARLDTLAVLDAFPNETTDLADIVLPVTQWAEEDGTMTNLEGRVIRRRSARRAPSGIRSDLAILTELADRLGYGASFPSARPEAIFDEIRRATAGSSADYAGITYDRIDRARGIYWPCPDETHPGTPRLFQERFAHPDGLARFVPVRHRPAAEEPDDEYPLWFTTGRYRAHYNSGAQTRAIPALLGAHAHPSLHIHPLTADRLRVRDGERVRVTSRRGSLLLDAEVDPGMRPDTLFAPFHWGGDQSANLLTIAAVDPTSHMPEFKLCAVRVEPISAGDAA